MAQDEKRRSLLGGVPAYGVAIVVVCALSIVVLVAIAPFDRPSADDFAYSVGARQVQLAGGGPFELLSAAAETSASYYQTWQGAFSAAFLMALQPGIFGSAWYQIGAYAMLACIVFSSLYLAYAVERHLFRSRERVWVAFGMLLATYLLQCMPAINEAVYWYNGAVNYTPWMCAAMVSSGCMICALRTESRVRAGVAIAVAGVLVFLAGGCNYMPAFACIMMMGGFAVFGLRARKFAAVVPLACALAGFALNAVSPGTAIRRAMFPDHPGIVSTLAHSLWQGLMNVNSFTNASLLVVFALAVPLIVVWARAGALRFSGKGLALVAALAFLGLVGVNCVPFYGTGSFGEGRTYNTAFEVFALGAFSVWVYLVCWVCQEARSARTGARVLVERLGAGRALAAIVAIVGVGLVVFWGGAAIPWEHGNSFQAARELANGTAAEYARAYDEREQALLAAGPDDVVEVSELAVRSDVLFFSDVVGKTDDWSGAMARYYGIGGITVVS